MSALFVEETDDLLRKAPTDRNHLFRTSILSKLYHKSVFSVEKTEEGLFRLEESCDNYFSVDLTREEMLLLANEIRELSNR